MRRCNIFNGGRWGGREGVGFRQRRPYACWEDVLFAGFQGRHVELGQSQFECMIPCFGCLSFSGFLMFFIDGLMWLSLVSYIVDLR